jgi:ATP-dependent protease ClpP protease subunit
MPTTQYQLHLKGYVGGYDFDRDFVDYILGKNAGKPVNVLIDSLGGSLATALSIASAFRNHGDVTVHFVGMNASAATIASLGAKHISIDASAMYLVHKCSMGVFEWDTLNADQFEQLIAKYQQTKNDLDKLDLNVASMYSAKCKKDKQALLDLMKVGGWLTAQEALDWGFVDEITHASEDSAPHMTDKLASAMASVGMPIPNVPIDEHDKGSAFGNFLNAVASLFRSPSNTISKAMNKTYTLICALLGVEAFAFADNKASLTDKQLSSIEDALKAKDDALAVNAKELADRDKIINDLRDQITELKKQPGDTTTNVVDNSKHNDAPICIGMDYNANINWIVAGQPRERRLNVIKSFYVKFERKIPALVADFCDYYRDHRNKTVVFYYDATALGSNYAVNEQDFRWVVIHEFEKHGWQVEPVYLGNPMRHDEKYLLINQGFAGKQRLMPFFNLSNNEDLILAIQSAGVSRGRNGFRKDKSGEKLAESEEALLEHRTDGTDAFDTLYIGCEKFPYRETYAFSTSGVV